MTILYSKYTKRIISEYISWRKLSNFLKLFGTQSNNQFWKLYIFVFYVNVLLMLFNRGNKSCDPEIAKVLDFTSTIGIANLNNYDPLSLNSLKMGPKNPFLFFFCLRLLSLYVYHSVFITISLWCFSCNIDLTNQIAQICAAHVKLSFQGLRIHF